MSRPQRFKVGTFLRIPLADGSFGYGRVLPLPDMAFYNHRTIEPSADLDEIAARPVLFTQAVRVLTRDRWTKLGIRPLEGEVAKPVVNYMQSLGNYRDCVIFDTAGMKKHVTPEECIGIEQAASWDDWHIEERLLDTFLGRPNAQEIRSRVRLKDRD